MEIISAKILIAVIIVLCILYLGYSSGFTPVPEWWDFVNHEIVVYHKLIGYGNIKVSDEEFRRQKITIETKIRNKNPHMTESELYNISVVEIKKLKHSGSYFLINATDKLFGDDEWLKTVNLTHMRSRSTNLGDGYIKVKNVYNVLPSRWIDPERPDRSYYVLVESDYVIPEEKLLKTTQFKLNNDYMPKHMLVDGELHYTPINSDIVLYGKKK